MSPESRNVGHTIQGMLKVFMALPARPLLHAMSHGGDMDYEDAEEWDGRDDVRPYSSQMTQIMGAHFLTELTQVRTPADFWKCIRTLMGRQARPPLVNASELQKVFSKRMNHPEERGRVPLATLRGLDGVYVNSIPLPTHNSSDDGYFSRPISIEEIVNIKAHVMEHNAWSATGADGVSYVDLLQVSNEELRELFQRCVDSCDAPQQWLTTILSAVGKPGKPLTDAENYRNIGLESCLLKMLTLLIDRRLQEWSDATGKVPPTQNRFRVGHQTANNVFTLRSVVETVRGEGGTVWVVLVDLKNTFPSVDQDALM